MSAQSIAPMQLACNDKLHAFHQTTIQHGTRRSIEDMISESAKPGKHGPASKLQQQLEQFSQSPKAQQKLVSQVINSVPLPPNARRLPPHNEQSRHEAGLLLPID
ncbi:MAG TPA: hypothetical protein VF471_07950 [Pseudoxanthomonas sp.]